MSSKQDRKDARKDRSRLTYKVFYAFRHPGRLWPHARRAARNRLIRVRYRDHVNYYRAVMRRNVAKNPDMAVGTPTRERWLALGKLQYDYLIQHGLKPTHRVLEIGCGNLRAGWRFIKYLDAGHYYGVDISPDILFSAQDTIVEFGLQDKVPSVVPVRDLTLPFLPNNYFDVVHAHSVFSHCPLEVIEECVRHVGRIMKRDGFFDFTFNATEEREHHVEHEDYYYHPDRLIALVADYGLEAMFMNDWEGKHPQSKLRIRRSDN
jgi:SAM-dependent methyltransferase